MATPPHEDPPGDPPRGESRSDGDDSTEVLADIAERLFESNEVGYDFVTTFLGVLSVVEASARTHFTSQKFVRYLGRRGVEPFGIVSLYLGGACSFEVTTTLHELTDEGLLRTRPHPRDEVSADIYELTPEAEQVLDEIAVSPALEDGYRKFRARYGRTGSWERHDDVVYNWLTWEDNYIAIDKGLYAALKRKVAYSGDFDPLFSDALDADDSVVSHIAPDLRGIARLALYIAEDAKEVPPSKAREEDPEEADADADAEDIEDYLRNRRRFSIRHIVSDFWEDDITDELVLLRGYVKERLSEHAFLIAEDRLKSAEEIRVTFHGDWLSSPRVLLEQVIGVVGYIDGSGTEPVIRVLGLLKWNELPGDLRRRFEPSDESVTDHREQTKALIEDQQAFLESHHERDGEVQDQLADEDRLREAIRDLRDSLPESDELRERLDEFEETLVESFHKYSDTAIKLYFWYEILNDIVPAIANLFR